MQYKHIDIHSHVNDPRFDGDITEVLSRMREAGVASIVVGTDKAMSERAITLAEGHEDLWATIGQHPTDQHAEEFDDAWYSSNITNKNVVAIGECGLDYFRLESDRASGKITNMDDEVDRQRFIFERQLELAGKSGKPLMIHGRPSKGTMDAYEDLLHMISAAQKKHGEIRGNVHFFVGDVAIAKQFLDLGFTMSFTGVLTFAREYDDVVRYLPLEKIMAETDAPYVAPIPYRGKRNEPAYVVETVQAIARIREQSEETIRKALLENSIRVFGVR